MPAVNLTFYVVDEKYALFMAKRDEIRLQMKKVLEKSLKTQG